MGLRCRQLGACMSWDGQRPTLAEDIDSYTGGGGVYALSQKGCQFLERAILRAAERRSIRPDDVTDEMIQEDGPLPLE